MNTQKIPASSSASQPRNSASRRSSASSSISSTSTSLSVGSSVVDTYSAGLKNSEIDRSRRYGFHRAAAVKDKNVIDPHGWGDKHGRRFSWSTTRVQLPNTERPSLVVPPYLSTREEARCQVGEKLYSSPQAGRMMSAQTFKEKKRAKKTVSSRTPPKALASQEKLPDEVTILQSWSPGQVFTPRSYYWMSKAMYAGTFVSMLPGKVNNLYNHYLPHFAESFRIRDHSTGAFQNISIHRWGSGSNQLDALRKGDRLYTDGTRYYSQELIKGMMPGDADLKDPKKNRTRAQADKEIKECEGY